MTADDTNLAGPQLATGALTSYAVAVLGPLAVAHDGVALDTAAWPRGAINLLLLLATAPRRRRLKEEISAALWPDATARSAASNLRYALHLLRRRLEGGEPYPVITEHGWISLSEQYDWQIDLERFEALLRGSPDRERLLLAASLVRGEPLIDVRNEEWAIPVRNHLTREVRDLRLRLAHAQRDAGAPNAALQTLETLLEQDPLDEEALQEALRALGGAGRIPEALRRYRRYVAQLRAEMGATPGDELRALIAQFQAPERAAQRQGPIAPLSADLVADLVPSYPLPTDLPLVGRAAALAPLRQALDALAGRRADAPRLILMSGEVGAGKTRLLAEVAHLARQRGALTLAGACYEQEGRLPYGPFHDALLDYARAIPRAALEAALGDLLPTLMRLIPEMRPQAPDTPEPRAGGDERLRLYAAVAQALERIAGGHGLILLLDDLHWADRGAIHLLHYLLRQPNLHGVLFVGAYREREPEGSDALADFLAEAHDQRQGLAHSVVVVSLDPLDQSDVRALARSWLRGGCAEPLAEALWRASAGAPLYALQALALLREQSRLECVAGEWRLCGSADDIVPTSLGEMIRRRLERLDQPEEKALRIAATLGSGFTHQALAAAWGADDDTLYDALDTLLDLELLREAGDGYAFAQPVIRQVVYRQIPLFHRQRLHARVGEALERLYADATSQHAAELAEHFRQAARWECALAYMTIAGDQAREAYAFEAAIQRYRAALDALTHTAPDARTEANLRLKLGKPLRLTGQMDASLQELRRAAELAAACGDDFAQTAAWVDLSKTYMRVAQRDRAHEALAQAERLLPTLATSAPTRELFAFYLELSTVYFIGGRYRETLAARERAVAIAEALRNERLVAQAEAACAIALSMLGQGRAASEVALRLIPRAAAIGDLETLRIALSQAAEQAMREGDFATSRAHRERELATARRLGESPIALFVQSNRAQLLLYLGEWDASAADAEEALAAFLARGDRFRSSYPLAYLGELALRRGDRAEGLRRLGECSDIARKVNDLQSLRYAQRILAEEELEAGQPAQAIARLEPLLDRPGLEEQDVPLLLVTLAWAHLALDDAATAERELTTALARAAAQDHHLIEQEALRIRGKLRAAQGRRELARDDFEQSLRLARQMPYPFAEARTLLDYAAWLQADGQAAETAEALAQARDIFQRLGAAQAAKEAAEALAEPWRRQR